MALAEFLPDDEIRIAVTSMAEKDRKWVREDYSSGYTNLKLVFISRYMVSPSMCTHANSYCTCTPNSVDFPGQPKSGDGQPSSVSHL